MAPARGSAFVLAAALAAHVVSLRAGWVLDDWELLVDNPYLRSTAGLRAVLTQELFVASGDPRHFPYYRPVSGLLYWVTFQLFGANGIAHHAFNLALHGLCAVLFFHVARGLRVSARGALVAGILFAVHPVGAEVVAYAGGRQDVLGWVITFATILLLYRARSSPRTFVLAFVGTLLAALTREMFLAAPALHAVAAATSNESNDSKRTRSAIAAVAGGGVAVGFVLVLRRFLGITSFDAHVSPARAIGAAAAVLLRFVKDVVLPTDLAADVTIFPLGAAAAAVLLGGAACAFALAWRTMKKRSSPARPAFVLGGVMLAVLVVLHAPVALRFGIISDRYAYGAVIALLLVATPAIDALLARIDPQKERLFGAAIAGLAVALVPLTWARAADYTNDQTLTLALLRDRPEDPRALLSQIVTLRSEDRSAEAYPLCRRYAELLPDDIVVNSCLAEEAFDQKDDARAVQLLEPWLRAQPRDDRARAVYDRARARLHQDQE